jgi:S-(hydroxymethyl)glutathione dehydrogenase/alcohol dehydrogenase
MKAALALDYGKLSIENVTLDPPRAGEVMIKMAATGVCYSDLSVLNGAVPMPLPLALGHEGAGVVQAVGAGVSKRRAGGPRGAVLHPVLWRVLFLRPSRTSPLRRELP